MAIHKSNAELSLQAKFVSSNEELLEVISDEVNIIYVL